MASVREAIERAGYKVARKAGISEHRLNRLRTGRVKTILDSDVEGLARAIKRNPDEVRAELERRARAHLVEIANEN